MKVAIAGAGPAARRHIIETLEREVTEDSRLVVFLKPSTKPETSNASRYAVDWAIANGTEFDLVLDTTGETSEYVDEISQEASSVTSSGNISRTLNPGDKLFLAWDDEDESCMRSLMTATRRGVDVFDLTSNNDQIVIDEDEPAETAVLEIQVQSDDEIITQVNRVLDRARAEIQAILDAHVASRASA